MNKLLKWAVDRLKEGSTWAGLAVIGAALGLENEVVTAGWEFIVAAAGLVAVFLKDKPEAPADPNG